MGWALVRLVAPYVIGFALLAGGWLWLDHSCWSSACQDERTQNGLLRTQIRLAQERATDLALLYAKTAEDADAKLRAQQSENDARFAGFEDRARRAGAGRSVAVAADSVRLWNDSANAANGIKAPASALGETSPPVPVPAEAYVREAELNVFVNAAAAAYKAVNDARLSCIAIYEGTQ
jgi:hypothetical protein